MKINPLNILGDTWRGYDKTFQRFPIASGFVFGGITTIAGWGLITLDWGKLGVSLGALVATSAYAWYVGRPK